MSISELMIVLITVLAFVCSVTLVVVVCEKLWRSSKKVQMGFQDAGSVYGIRED